jgi:plasmid stabilization system protein ParE
VPKKIRELKTMLLKAGVEIIRVIHGARDIEAILEQDLE